MTEAKAGYKVQVKEYSRTNIKYPTAHLYSLGMGRGFVPQSALRGYDVTETGKTIAVVSEEKVVWSRDVRNGLFQNTREKITTRRATRKANRLNKKAA